MSHDVGEGSYVETSVHTSSKDKTQLTPEQQQPVEFQEQLLKHDQLMALLWVHQPLLFLMVMFWHPLTDKEQNNIDISSNFGMYFELQ